MAGWRDLPDDGGVWTRQVLRERVDYRAAWAARAGRAPPPAHGTALFPVLIRSAVDLDAEVEGEGWGVPAPPLQEESGKILGFLGPRVRSRPNGHGGCFARCQCIMCQIFYCQIILCHLSSALTGPSAEET